jgi:hypothetical protein
MNDIETIKSELKDIKQMLITLQNTVDNLSKSTKKLDDHIDFVENTYDTLKYPLNFIKDTINTFTGNTLPQIRDVEMTLPQSLS